MRVVVALGANLGDRLATFREAIARVSRVASVLARSRVYETAPVGGPPQPDYLNAAILVEYTGPLLTLLHELQRIENELGRVRAERNGPRTLDLDILWSDGAPVEEPGLTVPHPRLFERAFALRPLLDVVPSLADAYVLPHEIMKDSGVRILPVSME
jgi:2-amino-4-hydroxy-6-hydroxymethyldihydropteridine diphosphokinase